MISSFSPLENPDVITTDIMRKYPRPRLFDKAKTPWFFGLLAGSKILSALSCFILLDFLHVNRKITSVVHRSPPTGVVFGTWSAQIQTLSVIQIL